MGITNYTDLKATVANYLARSDLTDQIPDFIALGELRLQRDLRIRQMLVVAQATITGGDSKVGLPTDFLSMRSIHLQTNPVLPLTYKSPNNFYNDLLPSESGRPKSYTILAAEFQFAPIPDSNYTVQMLYYAKPAALSATNPSNVWLAYAPDALLYAALGEAEPYLMNDARLQTWSALYDRAIDRISASDEGSEYGGQPMNMTVA